MLAAPDAVALLRERLPEFGPAIDEHLNDNFGELLLHLLMGDLGRFYMARQEDAELRLRFWDTVERLARDGDEAVKNAVHVSLVEWFVGSPGDDRDAFLAAGRLRGPATAEMAAKYLNE